LIAWPPNIVTGIGALVFSALPRALAPDSSKRLKDPIEETYYLPNSFDGVTIADPFMGGGTPLLEANRIGCNVIGTVRDEQDFVKNTGLAGRYGGGPSLVRTALPGNRGIKQGNPKVSNRIRACSGREFAALGRLMHTLLGAEQGITGKSKR
jgi:hypothetical protein